MTNIPGGLSGDKMLEDWVERLHQWGMQQSAGDFTQITTEPPCSSRTFARREKAGSRNTHARCACSRSGCNGQVGRSENCLRKSFTYYRPNENCSERKGQRFEAIRYCFDNINKEDKMTSGRKHYSANDHKGPTGGGESGQRGQ
jgi:hypothetical protein